jgi:chemotaxis protein MotB
MNYTANSFKARLSAIAMLGMCVSVLSGCHQIFVPADQLSAAQNHARDLYAQQQQSEQMLAAAESEKFHLGQSLSESESQLSTANLRIDNLMAERTELKDRYANSLLKNDGTFTGIIGAPLDGFEYDPTTGLNRFQGDVLFELGSDVIRPEQDPVIHDFVSAVNGGAASDMRILIVGHTDDQRIARPETAAKHPTNWHLSTDRSAAVILVLIQNGVAPERIASMGYSEFHPLEMSHSDPARQRNRRVELYVIPNDPSLAMWDPTTSRN